MAVQARTATVVAPAVLRYAVLTAGCVSVCVCPLQAMAELLDPEARYFGGRVIAQGVPEAGEDGAPQPLVFKRLLQVGAWTPQQLVLRYA